MIKGIVCDKNGSPLQGVTVELKNDKFETVLSADTDKAGQFAIETDKEAFYPYLTAVRDYAEEYLEYWCRNIKGDADIELNIRIDKLEVYGTNAFVIGGGYDSVLVYFRPMSLIKFKNGEENICPDITDIDVTIDGERAEVLEKNLVKESIGEEEMDAYLIQVKKTGDELSASWKTIELQIVDSDGNIGMAKTYK